MYCNHFFCQMPARAYSRGIAAFKVTQRFQHCEIVTYVCKDDMAAMAAVLTDADTVVPI